MSPGCTPSPALGAGAQVAAAPCPWGWAVASRGGGAGAVLEWARASDPRSAAGLCLRGQGSPQGPGPRRALSLGAGAAPHARLQGVLGSVLACRHPQPL